MSKRGTQQAGASNSTVSGGESDPTASNRHGRGQEVVGEAGGSQVANGNHRQRDKGGLSETSGEAGEEISLQDTREISSFSPR